MKTQAAIGLAVVLGLGVGATGARAGDWSLSKGISTSFDYTDNVNLDSDNPESELILRITPRISFSKVGGRARSNFSYAPSIRYFVQDSDAEFVNFLNASTNIELVRNTFFVNASATASQNLINRSGRTGIDGTSNRGNVTNTFTVRIDPRLAFHFGKYADLSVNPGGFSYVANSDSSAVNNTAGLVSMSLTSGRYFAVNPWSLRSSYRVWQGANGGDRQRFGGLLGTVGRVFNRKWRLDLSLGYDKNTFDSQNSTSGIRWRVTPTWTPNPRTLLSVGFGARFFGSDYSLNFRTRHKRFAWTATFSRAPLNSSQEFLTRPIFPNTNAFGDPIPDPTQDPNSTGIDPTGPDATNDNVFISDRFDTSLAFQGRRTTVNANMRYTRRDFQNAPDDTQDLELGLGATRNLEKRLSSSLRARWVHHVEDNSKRQDWDQYYLVARLNYTLGRRSSASLSYNYTTRTYKDSGPQDDYDENRVRLTFSWAL